MCYEGIEGVKAEDVKKAIKMKTKVPLKFTTIKQISDSL